MSFQKEDLVKYASRAVASGLVSGASGNVSARDGNIAWLKPSGIPLDEMVANDFCGVDLRTGDQISGKRRPTSDANMHIEIYRRRPDVFAVFNMHAPWTTGLVSAGVPIKPILVNFASDIGRFTTIPYQTPSTLHMAQAVAEAVAHFDTIFMAHHGVIATGASVRQAFYRCLSAEDNAKAITSACINGKPHFLNDEQISEINSLMNIQYRIKIVEKGGNDNA